MLSNSHALLLYYSLKLAKRGIAGRLRVFYFYFSDIYKNVLMLKYRVPRTIIWKN